LTKIDPETAEQLARAVERCGLPRTKVEISYEDYLQSEEVRVLSPSLTDTQIECLRQIGLAAPFPIVTFVSETTAKRDWELSDIRYREDSLEWFRQRGLLDRLPVFDPEKEDAMQFARRLEEFCGIEPGTVFEWNERLRVITPRGEWIGESLRKGWLWRKIHGAQHARQFECLTRAMSATNAWEHGLRFGFIGNEAYASEEPQE
jgi:hypothetical protein